MLKSPSLADAPHTAAEIHDGGHNLVRNLLAGGAASLLKAVLQLAMLPVMGRLLGPKEFGLYATVLPIVTFFTVIADGGLGSSLAKERSTDTTVWNTAFYVMLGLGIMLAGLLNLCGLGLAAFMHEPRLYGLTALLSASFLLVAISTLPAARLVQRNDLVSLSAVDTIAAFVGAGAAVTLAWKGFGATSLAVQSVVTFAGRAIGLNLLAFERPRGRFSIRTLADHAGTGGVLVGTRVVDMFCRIVETVTFSKAFGPATLGTYTFANQVSRFLCESASNPIWSATYAQSLKLDGARLGDLLRNMVRLMLLATLPAACLIVAAAPDVFPVLLGAKWQHTGGFLQILILSYSFATTASIGGAVLLATGQNWLFFTTTAFQSVARVVAVTAGFWLSATVVVDMVAVANLAYAGVMIVVASKAFGVAKGQFAATAIVPLAAGGIGALACVVTLHVVARTQAGVLASLMLGGACLLGALLVLDKDFSGKAVRGLLARGRLRRTLT